MENWYKKKKKKAIQKIDKSLNFAESQTQRKTNARGSFETFLFFLSLTCINPIQNLM